MAYQGTRYLGWQKTLRGPSVQQTLEQALAVLLRRKITTEAASRTDAGVHARGQVVGFFVDFGTDLEKLKRGLNALLPKDVVVHTLQEVTTSFHPTLDAKAKEYHYEIVYHSSQSPFLRDFSWHFPRPLDVVTMRQASAHLIGPHDFSSFCNAIKLHNTHPTCHIYKCTIEEKAPGHISIQVLGNRFLYKMMRNLAGTLAYVGCGKITVRDIPRIIEAKDRTRAGTTAPAAGLFLQKVLYDFPQ